MVNEEQLLTQYFEPVYRFSLKLTGNANNAEEITLMTFYRAIQHIELFRGDCVPTTWLCQITRNLIIDTARRRKESCLWMD